jgi:cytochrome c
MAWGISCDGAIFEDIQQRRRRAAQVASGAWLTGRNSLFASIGTVRTAINFLEEIMNRYTRVVLLAAAAGVSFHALANEPGEKDAIAMVEKGAAFMKASGKDEMIKKINAKDPDYLQGALYLTMRDQKGVILANPVNAAMIGKDLVDVPDADGKLFRREILELAKTKGKGWVDYKFKNPASGKVEAKTSYIYKVADVTLEAGIYKK